MKLLGLAWWQQNKVALEKKFNFKMTNNTKGIIFAPANIGNESIIDKVILQ